MTFPQAIEAGFKNYVNFSGRAARSEYWFWILFSVVGQIAFAIADAMTGIGVLSALFVLSTLLPGISVAVRRLHDLDKSGWHLLLVFIPLVGAIILIVWACQEGTRGPNRFGSPAEGERIRSRSSASSILSTSILSTSSFKKLDVAHLYLSISHISNFRSDGQRG